MIKIYLDGTEVQVNPQDESSLNERLYFSDTLKGYLLEISGTLTFVGNDYDYLRGIYEADYCNEVRININLHDNNGTFQETIFRGYIKMADIEWMKVTKQAVCEIIDDGYIARIDNNKNIKFYLNVGRSKNDVDITAYLPPVQDLNLFSAWNGRYFTDEVPNIPKNEGYFLYDAFKFLVAAMSDGEMDFDSNYLSYNVASPANDSEAAWSVLVSGEDLRINNGVAPYISFEDLYRDAFKGLNVFFGIERQSNGRPLLRIEDFASYRQQDSGVMLDGLQEITESIDRKKIYGRILFGCSTFPSAIPLPNIRFSYQAQEEYWISGQCNTDTDLNLRFETLVISSNTITDAMVSRSGFSKGQQKVKGSTPITGAPFELEDPSVDFIEREIQIGDTVINILTGEWTWITTVTNNILTLADDIFTTTYDNYEIYGPSSSDEYFENTFLVHCDKTTSSAGDIRAKQGILTVGILTYYTYNDYYSNAQVANRHAGTIPQNIVTFLGNGNDEMRCSIATTPFAASDDPAFFTLSPINPLYSIIKFNNDTTGGNFDPNNNYDPATGFYTIPADGAYYFEADIVAFNQSYGGFNVYQFELTHTDSTNTTIKTLQALTPGGSPGVVAYAGGPPSLPYPLAFTITGQAGDLVYVTAKVPHTFLNVDGTFNSAWGVFNFSSFRCVQSANGGGVYTGGNPELAYIIQNRFEQPINLSDWNSIKANPYKYINVNYGKNFFTLGYNLEISRNILSGKATLVLEKSRNGA